MTPTVQSLFPGASKDCIDRNPSGDSTGIVARSTAISARRGKMNETERLFSLILDAQKAKGEILRWEFEGITLRFAGVKYTPDFVVLERVSRTTGTLEPVNDQRGVHAACFPASSENKTAGVQVPAAHLKFIEVKGPFIKGNRERAVERFRHARTYWPEFQFELWQKQKTGWKQIY